MRADIHRTSGLAVRRRWRGFVAVVATLVAIVGCTELVPIPPTEIERLDLYAQVPIAAAQVELQRPAGASVVSVMPLQPGLLVRTATVGNTIRVAWIGASATSGPQVRVTLERPEGTTASPQIESASAYDDADGDDLGPGVLVWEATEAAVVLDAPLAVPPVDHLSAAPGLELSFADHPLGDLDADLDLDVRDAVVLLDLLAGAGWSDFARYHADLDGDGGSDLADAILMLDKVVDPSLPARLHVKHGGASFVQLDPATDRDAIVLVANGGGQPFADLGWTVPPGVAVAVTGIEGQSAGLGLTLPAAARRGWLPGRLTVTGAGEAVTVDVGHLVVLIAGQSNASGRGSPLSPWPEQPDPSVRMFGNDYLWHDAVEPMDSSTGQEDEISVDLSAAYSFGTRLGHRLLAGTSFRTYLIPAADGGSPVDWWLPRTNLLDRGTLFGSANYRAQVSAALQPNPVTVQAYPSEGGPVNAIVWYQGESDDDANERSAFIAGTDRIMDAFDAELDAPVIYVQLASNCKEQLNLRQHAVADLQRRMETTWGDASTRRPGFHMVSAFDLPRSDCIHLSSYGLRVLADRIDLAIREHVFGEDVDGTGPRLESISHAGQQITLRTSHTLSDAALDPKLFAVFDGPPEGDFDDPTALPNYGTNVVGIASVARDPSDPTAVRITLTQAPVQVPFVRYMAEISFDDAKRTNTTPSYPQLWERVVPGAVRAADGALPLPAFGPLSVNTSF